MKTHDITRRGFLHTTSLGTAAGTAFYSMTQNHIARADTKRPEKRLPREVWIATMSQYGLEAQSYGEMIELMFDRMAGFESYRPDIVCLPETFPFTSQSKRPLPKEVAEVPPGPISGRFADYAKKHNCYVICPIYTKENGNIYNAAVVFDRNGSVTGEYRKMHPTIGEIKSGITPGPSNPPVFRTDFGTIGIQICFDIEWPDGWQKLGEKGTEIVFWPSAFAGGKMVNARAFNNKYCVVSSTNKDTAKICDITGEEVAWTGRWNRWICANVNLEKAFLHTWPYFRRFDEIHAKYGGKIRITNYHEEEWSIIESRSPDVKVADILKEFDLKTIRDHLHAAEVEQDKHRL